jgi:hypothetical protein
MRYVWWHWAVLVIFAIGVCIWGVVSFCIARQHVAPDAVQEEVQSSRAPEEASTKPWFGLCARSQSPRNLDDFHRAVMSDVVLAREYRNFKWAVASTIDAHSAYQRVTYRKGDNVFWTASPLLITAGERLFSDGVMVVRAHCCNKIAATVERGGEIELQGAPPPEALQPESGGGEGAFERERWLSVPAAGAGGVVVAGGFPPLWGPVLVPGGRGVPLPGVFTPGGGVGSLPSSGVLIVSPGVTTPSTVLEVVPEVVPPVSTPEPSSTVLLVVGLVSVVLIERALDKRGQID